MKETQQTISEWAHHAFGDAGSHMRVAARANEEMAELLRAISTDRLAPECLEEAADVVIVLCRLATRMGGDLWVEVEKKMQVNRGRKWERDGTGHGYHVRQK